MGCFGAGVAHAPCASYRRDCVVSGGGLGNGVEHVLGGRELGSMPSCEGSCSSVPCSYDLSIRCMVQTICALHLYNHLQVMDIKNVQRQSLAAYKSPTGQYVAGQRCWNVDAKADVALPCATQVRPPHTHHIRHIFDVRRHRPPCQHAILGYCVSFICLFSIVIPASSQRDTAPGHSKAARAAINDGQGCQDRVA